MTNSLFIPLAKDKKFYISFIFNSWWLRILIFFPFNKIHLKMNLITLKFLYKYYFLHFSIWYSWIPPKELNIFWFYSFIFVFELLVNYEINRNAKTKFLGQKQKHFSIKNNVIDTNGKIKKDVFYTYHWEIFQNVLF